MKSGLRAHLKFGDKHTTCRAVKRWNLQGLGLTSCEGIRMRGKVTRDLALPLGVTHTTVTLTEPGVLSVLVPTKTIMGQAV